jgi:hypothetical protein
VIALSASYVSACYDDLLATIGYDEAGRVSILSAGASLHPEFGDALLPLDARLQPEVGGSRQSLNVRVLRRLLADGAIEHEAMRRRLAELLEAQPPIRQYEREAMTDVQVREYIRSGLATDPKASKTTLLRQLRDSGSACEQGRFGRLFASEKASK